MNLDRIIAIRNNKTVYKDVIQCLKVFEENFSKAAVLQEALNQARIEETLLHVPKITEVVQIDGKWAIVYEYIKGKTLTQLMNEQPENTAKYLDQLLELQLLVHSKTCHSLMRQKDRLNAMIRKTELSATVRFDLHTRLEEMPKHIKICHGDFTPSNIVITPDGTPYILDWSRATQGNGTADAMNTYLLLCLHHGEAMGQQYLDSFCDKAGIDPAYAQRWIPIMAAALMSRCGEKDRQFLYEKINIKE